MKRAALLVTSVILAVLLFAVPASALNYAEKDGISVKFDYSEPNLDISVSNMNCVYSDKFTGEVLVDGDPKTTFEVTVGKGESKKVSYDLAVLSAETTAEETDTSAPDTTAEPKKNGCGGLAAGISVFVILAGTAGLVPLKNGKRFAALFLVTAMLPIAALFAVPADAAVTHRTLSVTGKFGLDGEKREVIVNISYDYDFKEAKAVKTAGFDKFEITYYWGPQHAFSYDEEYIKAVADAGFTSIPLENGTVEENKKALAVLKKYGLTCSALMDPRIYAISYGDGKQTQEEVDAVVRDVVNEYKDFDNVKGWWIIDEPGTAKFPILAKLVSAFRSIDPDRQTSINLFPTYANNTQLGANSYVNYLEQFAETVKPSYLSYDHYHFKADNTARAGFFENLSAVRASGLANGLDQMQIILLTEHMSYANVTEEQLRFEVNMSLAFGMKRISYFTFILDDGLLAQGWTNSCMDTTGKKYQHYYDVQKINEWLLPLGNELFGKTSTGVYFIKCGSLEKGCESYNSYGDLGAVSGSNFVVGFFDDGSFMIVNKRYGAGELGENRLTFLEVGEGLEYFDTATASWKPFDGERNDEGNYTALFSGGEGILFRVK